MITQFKIFEQINEDSIKQNAIDIIISKIDERFDCDILKILLKKIDRKHLIGSLSEDEWEEYKNYDIADIIDAVINNLYIYRRQEDFTVLDELLNFISEKDLIDVIPKDEWNKYLIEKEAKKFNL